MKGGYCWLLLPSLLLCLLSSGLERLGLYCNTSLLQIFGFKADPEISRPSLNGHSQERPLSLMWPEFFAATTMNALILLLPQCIAV